MAIDRVVFHQLLIEDETHAMRCIVYDREGGDRPRRHAECLEQQVGLAEAKAARPHGPVVVGHFGVQVRDGDAIKRAVAAPIPDAPPVITATLSCNFPILNPPSY